MTTSTPHNYLVTFLLASKRAKSVDAFDPKHTKISKNQLKMTPTHNRQIFAQFLVFGATDVINF